MDELRTRNIILAAAGLATVSFLVMVVLSYRTFRSLDVASRLVQHTNAVRDALEDAQLQLKDVQTGMRGFFLTGDERFFTRFEQGAEGLLPILPRLLAMTADNPRQQSRLYLLQAAVPERLAEVRHLHEILRGQGMAAMAGPAAALGPRPLEQITRTLADMKTEEDRLLAQRLAESRRDSARTAIAQAASLGLAGVLLVTAGILLRRNLAENRRTLALEREASATIYQRSQETQVALTQLRLANEELEAFSYSVSHDLRAPLRHIAGYSDMLGRHAASLDERGRHYLRTIADAARRMGQLIDDLLAFSRIGRVELRRAAVDPAMLVEEVRRSLTPEINGRTVRWDIAPLPAVQADPNLFRQVLANLLGNAVKYTRERPVARIEIGALPSDPGETVLFVRDNGAGFDMKYADKLFGVFQRLHSAADFEGTGVGLANVRRIIVRHGGRVWAEGKVGEGAVFYLALPHLS